MFWKGGKMSYLSQLESQLSGLQNDLCEYENKKDEAKKKRDKIKERRSKVNSLKIDLGGNFKSYYGGMNDMQNIMEDELNAGVKGTTRVILSDMEAEVEKEPGADDLLKESLSQLMTEIGELDKLYTEQDNLHNEYSTKIWQTREKIVETQAAISQEKARLAWEAMQERLRQLAEQNKPTNSI